MGLATAKDFAKAGAAVALADIDGGAARVAAEELAAEDAKTLAVTCDVTDEAAVKEMVEESASRRWRRS